MRNTSGEKVRNIIREEFDTRLSMAVVQYIICNGYDNLKEATEEDILAVKGNALMTDRFSQSLVRAAVRICKECHEIDEFLPFIVNHLYVPNAKMNEVTFWKDEMTKWKWEEVLDSLDVDYEGSADEIESITINANVVEIERYEEE